LRRAGADSFRNKEIKQAGLYWALVQYARAIRRGAVIVASHDANGDATGSERGAVRAARTISCWDGDPVQCCDFARVSHGGEKSGRVDVLVLTNPGEAKELTVACGGRQLR